MNTVEEIRDQAMALSASERAGLAHELLASLDAPGDAELGAAHEEEIQRRLQMLRDGTAKGRPADQVFADIKAKHA